MDVQTCDWDVTTLGYAWERLQEHRRVSPWHEKDMLAELLEEAFNEGYEQGKGDR